MSKTRPKADSNDPKMDMTPIIDVVFNLLIFFMLTMNFVEEEGMLFAHLPKKEGIRETEVLQKTVEEIRVRLIKENDADITRVLVGQKEIEDPLQNPSPLVNQLASMMAIENKAPVVIDPSQKAEFKYVIAVLNSCKSAGVQEIKFAGKPIK